MPTSSGLPIDALRQALGQNTLVKIFEEFERTHSDVHMKDLVVDEVGPNREILVNGRWVVNFGSDSFLGLDCDPRVLQAVRDGLDRWGSHNGSSRAFASVRSMVEAEAALASWLDVESTLIYPSVTLANLGAIPGLVGRKDVIVMDELAHNSIQEGARLAQAGGVRVATFSHSCPESLEATLRKLDPYRLALICVDGVYSMNGDRAPLTSLNEVALANRGVLYIDDAHGTGVLGEHGRGTVLESLGSYDNTFVVGSLSKAFSCAGGFVAGPRAFQKLLKIKSNTYIFGGPVVPAYCDAICKVVEILRSDEYATLRGRLDRNIMRLRNGLTALDLVVTGGDAPIQSVFIGDEAATLQAGRFLFDEGYYVQSVLFPAVPYHGGVIRIQCNANQDDAMIDGLLRAFANLKVRPPIPSASSIGAA